MPDATASGNNANVALKPYSDWLILLTAGVILNTGHHYTKMLISLNYYLMFAFH